MVRLSALQRWPVGDLRHRHDVAGTHRLQCAERHHAEPPAPGPPHWHRRPQHRGFKEEGGFGAHDHQRGRHKHADDQTVERQQEPHHGNADHAGQQLHCLLHLRLLPLCPPALQGSLHHLFLHLHCGGPLPLRHQRHRRDCLDRRCVSFGCRLQGLPVAGRDSGGCDLRHGRVLLLRADPLASDRFDSLRHDHDPLRLLY
mmetsp:Transcript_82708/g.246682  ORF Transcript_82708/g.246682 Transcript_82708/m.246682 type:complete len:200 (+) Transcript_82708:626-1225(+)